MKLFKTTMTNFKTITLESLYDALRKVDGEILKIKNAEIEWDAKNQEHADEMYVETCEIEALLSSIYSNIENIWQNIGEIGEKLEQGDFNAIYE